MLLHNNINKGADGRVIVVQSVTLERNKELCFAQNSAKKMRNEQFVQLSVQKLQKNLEVKKKLINFATKLVNNIAISTMTPGPIPYL